jgi:hypothetical protein
MVEPMICDPSHAAVTSCDDERFEVIRLSQVAPGRSISASVHNAEVVTATDLHCDLGRYAITFDKPTLKEADQSWYLAITEFVDIDSGSYATRYFYKRVWNVQRHDEPLESWQWMPVGKSVVP